MKSSDQGTGPPEELAQLLRLRKVRTEAAEAKVREQRAAVEQAEAAVQTRHQKIQEDRQRVEHHATYVVGPGAADLPRFAGYFDAMRDLLGDKLERNEYGLIDDQERLESQHTQWLDMRQAWMREQARQDGVQEALQRSRTALACQRESQVDDEIDELRRSGPVSLASSSSSLIRRTS